MYSWILVPVCILGTLGCMGQNDQGASDPAPGPPDDFQGEPSLALATGPTAGPNQRRIVMGFIDFEGELNQSGSPVFANDHPSVHGISISEDDGLTWTQLPKLRPDENCQDLRCVFAFRGDPWLDANGPFVLYASIAEIGNGPAPLPPAVQFVNGVTVARSVNGGLSFDELKIVADEGLETTDKVSLDLLGTEVKVVYLASVNQLDNQRIKIVSSSNLGTTWEPPQFIKDSSGNELAAAPFIQFSNPIIRTVDANRAYLFVQQPVSTTPTTQTARYRVFRIKRNAPGADWLAQEIFTDTFEHKTAYSGASGRFFRNRANGDFDMWSFAGQTSGQFHLWLVASEKVEGRANPGIKAFDCIDNFTSNPPACVGSMSGEWRSTFFGNMQATLPDGTVIDTDGEDDQIMPEVSVGAAATSNNEVRITWLRHGLGSGLGMRAEGVRSFNSGMSWDNLPRILTTPVGTANALCPTPFGSNLPNGGILGTIGDYNSSIILPSAAFGTPRAVTAFPYTRAGCVNAGRLTQDLHVEASVW